MFQILNQQNKKLLRDYFNRTTGNNAKTIIAIRKILKVRSNKTAWNRLNALYQVVAVAPIVVAPPQLDTVTEIKNPSLSKLRAELKKHKGSSVVVEYIIRKVEVKQLQRTNANFEIIMEKSIRNRFVVRSVNYDVPQTFSSWWAVTSWGWIVDSGNSIFEHYSEIGRDDIIALGSVFIYPTNSNVTTKVIVQHFKEGISNCLLLPIRSWATEKLAEAKTKPTKSRYNVILGHINKLETTYGESGIPESSISEVCNLLQIDINVELPFSETKFIEASCIKKRLKLFRFMNSRLNHIDLNEVTNNDNYEEVTRERLLEIKAELDTNHKFYTYKKDLYNVTSISTLNKIYKLSNLFSETIGEFEISTGLNYCKIDDVDDLELSQFIRLGTNYNETVDFIDIKKVDRETVKHIDMKKAYANYKTCSYYSGFLGKITDFRQTDKIEGLGIYRITNLKFSENNSKNIRFKKYNDKMKIYFNNNVYPSPELKMLNDYGGCWGVKPLDFNFSEKMLDGKDDNGSSYYAKWTGLCDSHKLEKKFYINCERDYFEIIRNNCGMSIARWYNNGEGEIGFTKKHNYHLGHITAFITSYQRMNVIEQLLQIKVDKIVRVCVDGIYFYGDVELKNVFRHKDDRNFNNEAGKSYVSQAKENCVFQPISNTTRKHFAKELHLGEGGCGKTHMNCNDKGLQRVLFLAPSWKLAISKRKEIGMHCSVWARALSDDPEKVSFIKEKANVLIIDEVSMLTEHQKQQFFTLYSDMKIIMCGDLGYQLPCIEGIEMNSTGFNNIQKHTTDWRCKDARLKEIKTTLRKMIANKSSKTDINTWVMSAFRELGRCINVETLKTMYDINDMILCGTNEVKNFYTGLFAGKFEQEKYYVMENNRLYNNGEIVIGTQPDKCKCEVRHSFTTHSIQGETASHNLFIDSSKMFDSRMFYTAISRAKTIDQIYLIENASLIFKYEYAKIYKIVSKNGLYVGSTINALDKRFKEHKQAHEQFKKGKGKYMTSFALLDDPDATIEKIESFKCNDIKDLWEREKEIIQQTKCVNKTYNENK